MFMKKILIIITTAFVPTGGLTSVMMNYYRYIDKSDLLIDFASSNNAPVLLTNELMKHGGKYIQLPKRKKIFNYFITLRHLCKQYDVVHVNGNSATSAIELFAAKIAGVRIRIAHNHNTKTDYPFINLLLMPFFQHSYNIGLACSQDAGKWLFGNNKFEVLNNAIDIQKYAYNKKSRIKIRNEFSIPQDAVVLGHVGKYNLQKNHVKLLYVFREYLKKHRDSFLLCVGYGPLKDKIEDKIRELNLNGRVILTGERLDVPELLCAMDFFVFPSLFEGLGMAVIEAQASGLPCLLSDKVPNDVFLSKKIKALPLECNAKEWVSVIDELLISSCNREEYSVCCSKSITEGGYNIKIKAECLRQLYLTKI